MPTRAETKHPQPSACICMPITPLRRTDKEECNHDASSDRPCRNRKKNKRTKNRESFKRC